MNIGGLLRDTNTGGSKGRSLRNNTRAQSVVIGSILVFGLLVLSYGIFQTTVIPSANEDIEVEHSQQVRGEMQDLRNDVLQSASTGQDTRQTVKVGVEYPNRLLFINPGPTAGSLGTEGTSESQVAIALENVVARDDETEDYLNGNKRVFSTGAIVYRQDYNIYQSGPQSVAVGNSLTYSKYSEGEFVSTGQQIISGKEISLVALDGDLFRSEVAQYTVDTEAVSAPTTTVPVRNDSEAIEITISTRLSEETLIQDVFRSQIDDDGDPPVGVTECSDISADNSSTDRYVNNCEFDDSAPGEFNNFTLILEPGNTYTLELAKVGVGTEVTDASSAYITDVEGHNVSVPQGGEQKVTFQVRDEYNNPYTGATVNVSIGTNPGKLIADGRTNKSLTNLSTDSEGKVSVIYDAPFGAGSDQIEVDVRASYDIDPGADYADFESNTARNASATLRVINGSQVNQAVPLLNDPSGIVIQKANFTDGNGCQDCVIEITFKNLANENRNLSALRYAFYSADSQGASGSESGSLLSLTNTNPDTDLEIKGGFKEVAFGFNKNEERTLEFAIYCSDNKSDGLNIDESEFFVIEGLENNTRGKSWFFAPRKGPDATGNSGSC